MFVKVFHRCFRGVFEVFEVFPARPASHRSLKASQGQFKFNPSRRGQYFEALYIKYQNECARGLRRQTCNLKVPGSSPGGATRRPRLRETKQPPRRAKQQHTGLQACAALNRAHGPRSAEKSTLYGVIQFKFKLNQFKFKLISN